MSKIFTADDVVIPHADVLRLRQQGKLSLGISEPAAKRISQSRELKPTRYAAAGAFKFWNAVAASGFFYTVYLSFTSAWWWFIVGFIAAAVVRANAAANQENLLDAAMIDPESYEKVSAINGWVYKMTEDDAEPFFTGDYRLGREALQRAGLPIR